jgi:hypothetical protein
MGAPLDDIAPAVKESHRIILPRRTPVHLDVTRVNIYNYALMRRPTLAAVGQSLAGRPAASKP